MRSLFQLNKKTVKWVFILSALIFAKKGFCLGVPVNEAPINGYGTPANVSISTDTGITSAWTMVPPSQTSGRMGVFLSVPSANTGDIVGHVGNCTSTSIATSVRPVKLLKGATTALYPLREDVCLWLVTTHTAAETISYQEVKQ